MQCSSFAKYCLVKIWKISNRDGNISHYYPDFIVKLPKNRIVIVETKGNADLDTPLKMQRLRQWCEDVNKAQDRVKYECVYAEQEEFEKYGAKSFCEMKNFMRDNI